MKLQRREVQQLIDDILRDMPTDQCRTCDCFLGFLTRLELDSKGEDVSDIIHSLKPPKAAIHGCLGCNPCPPAEAYTNYTRRNLIQITYIGQDTARESNHPK